MVNWEHDVCLSMCTVCLSQAGGGSVATLTTPLTRPKLMRFRCYSTYCVIRTCPTTIVTAAHPSPPRPPNGTSSTIH